MKNLLDILTEDRELPDGCDRWAIRTVHPDLTSQHGYRYPYPGAWAEAPGPILDHRGECPVSIGDGICAARTWAAMESGGVPARALLLVAYSTSDVLGGSADKMRLRRMFVADLIDGERLVRDHGRGAYLRRAYLIGADLGGADLSGAYLSGAYLSGSYLSDSNLSGADLHGAYLSGSNLRGAYLRGAYLRGAYLIGANLNCANLHGANLHGANLSGANLSGANLHGWTVGPDGFAQQRSQQ
jgi:hypothetical protein